MSLKYLLPALQSNLSLLNLQNLTTTPGISASHPTEEGADKTSDPTNNALANGASDAAVSVSNPEAALHQLLLEAHQLGRSAGKKTDEDSWFESLERLIGELKSHPESEPFQKPVPKKVAPDYDKVIAQPMDLATMSKKIRARDYKNKKQFARDLNLIWSNCLTYNSVEGHPMRAHARFMKKLADHYLEYILDRPDAPPFPPAITQAIEARQALANGGTGTGASGGPSATVDGTGVIHVNGDGAIVNGTGTSTGGGLAELAQSQGQGQGRDQKSTLVFVDGVVQPVATLGPATTSVAPISTWEPLKNDLSDMPALMRTQQTMGGWLSLMGGSSTPPSTGTGKGAAPSSQTRHGNASGTSRADDARLPSWYPVSCSTSPSPSVPSSTVGNNSRPRLSSSISFSRPVPRPRPSDQRVGASAGAGKDPKGKEKAPIDPQVLEDDRWWSQMTREETVAAVIPQVPRATSTTRRRRRQSGGTPNLGSGSSGTTGSAAAAPEVIISLSTDEAVKTPEEVVVVKHDVSSTPTSGAVIEKSTASPNPVTQTRSSKKKKRQNVTPPSKYIQQRISHNITVLQHMRETVSNMNAKMEGKEEGEAKLEWEEEEEVWPMKVAAALNESADNMAKLEEKEGKEVQEPTEGEAVDALQLVASGLLAHVGFEGSSQLAFQSIASLAAQKLQALGRTFRMYLDGEPGDLAPEEIIQLALMENGSDVDVIDSHIVEDVLRHGTKLDDFFRKLKTAYEDSSFLSPEDVEEDDLGEDDMMFGGIPGMDNMADFLGLPDIGAIPRQLLKARRKDIGEVVSVGLAKARKGPPPLDYPPPPPLISLSASDIPLQIGLLQSFYRDKLGDSLSLEDDDFDPNLPPMGNFGQIIVKGPGGGAAGGGGTNASGKENGTAGAQKRKVEVNGGVGKVPAPKKAKGNTNNRPSNGNPKGTNVLKALDALQAQETIAGALV